MIYYQLFFIPSLLLTSSGTSTSFPVNSLSTSKVSKSVIRWKMFVAQIKLSCLLKLIHAAS